MKRTLIPLITTLLMASCTEKADQESKVNKPIKTEIMQKEEKNTSWRSAWVVVHLMNKDDPKIKKHLGKIIKRIEGKNDGHQRELIKIVRKMNV